MKHLHFLVTLALHQFKHELYYCKHYRNQILQLFGSDCSCPPLLYILGVFHCMYVLKAKKTHGFYSCIVISIYPFDIPSIKKGTEYRDN